MENGEIGGWRAPCEAPEIAFSFVWAKIVYLKYTIKLWAFCCSGGRLCCIYTGYLAVTYHKLQASVGW